MEKQTERLRNLKEKFLKTAYKRTGDMDVLLNQLFYLSKLETGNMPLNLTLLDLPSFINSYVTGKREITDQKELELVLDLDESTVAADRREENEQMAEESQMIEADPEQLRRIFEEFYREDSSRNQKEGKL